MYDTFKGGQGGLVILLSKVQLYMLLYIILKSKYMKKKCSFKVIKRNKKQMLLTINSIGITSYLLYYMNRFYTESAFEEY